MSGNNPTSMPPTPMPTPEPAPARQTTMSTYYVTIISALLGVLAFKDRSLAQIDAAMIWAICAPGIWCRRFGLVREEFEAMKKHGR